MSRLRRLVVSDRWFFITGRVLPWRGFLTTSEFACLEMSRWREASSEASWRKFLAEGETECELQAIRRSTYSGRPLGPKEFIQALERQTMRRLTPGPRGRPREASTEEIDPTLLLKTRARTMNHALEK